MHYSIKKGYFIHIHFFHYCFELGVLVTYSKSIVFYYMYARNGKQGYFVCRLTQPYNKEQVT